MVDGRAINVDTRTTLASVSLSYLDASIMIQCFDSDGEEIELSGESRFLVRRGDVVRLSATGFKPDTEIHAAIFSTPTALGTVKIDANGDGVQQWKVPDSLEAGTHTLIASGDLAEVDNAVFGLRVIVDEKSFASRVASSVAARVLLGLGIVLGLLIPATRRRRNSESQPITR